MKQIWQCDHSIIFVFGGESVLFLLLLLGRSLGVWIGILFDYIVIIAIHFGCFSAFLVYHPLFFFILLFFRLFVASVDEPHDLLVLKLIQSQLFFLFLQDEFFSLQFILEVFALALKCTNFFIAFLLYICALAFQLFDFFLKLSNDLLVDFFRIGLLFFQLVLDLLHFFLLDDVCLVQLADLLFFLVDGLHLLLGFLRELLQLFLHSADLVCSLLIFVVFEGLLLRLPNLLQ